MSCPGGTGHWRDTSGMCQECFDLSYELEFAERYAVASIIYYSDTGIDTGMNDAQFDGICDWLIKRKVWGRIPWLEYDMLRAGTGYDTSKFPPELHEKARAQMERALL